MERSARIGSLKSVIRALDAAAGKAGINGIKVIICGGLAAIAYGMSERATLDIDAEVAAGFDAIKKLKEGLKFPAELSADISRWSMIDIPGGYRERVVPYNEVKTKHIHIFLRFISKIYGWFLAPAICLKYDTRLFAGVLLT